MKAPDQRTVTIGTESWDALLQSEARNVDTIQPGDLTFDEVRERFRAAGMAGGEKAAMQRLREMEAQGKVRRVVVLLNERYTVRWRALAKATQTASCKRKQNLRA